MSTAVGKGVIMSALKKRSYNAAGRQAEAQKTRERVLQIAQQLFQSAGFEKVTIADIAGQASVAVPTVYALFQSKLGLLQAIIDAALPEKEREALVQECITQGSSAAERLENTARLTRRLYDAEQQQLSLLPAASLLDPAFKKLEQEREMRRYKRQADSVKELVAKGAFAAGITPAMAQDIIWAFTGRDLYRMLVIERKWSADEYEKWLAKLLIETLLK